VVPNSVRSRRPGRRAGVIATIMSILLGLLLSSVLVWQASQASFSSTVTNASNNWTAGSVALSDDDSSSAMFAATSLKPGSTGTHCIAVTSAGTLPASVKLYATNGSTTNGLSSYVDLSITQGTGGSFSSCNGFSPLGSNSSVFSGTLAGFISGCTNFASGVGVWAPTGSGSETHTYAFSYTIDAAAPASVQGGTASVSFTWESQSS
jgi:hypothetical protein